MKKFPLIILTFIPASGMNMKTAQLQFPDLQRKSEQGF